MKQTICDKCGKQLLVSEVGTNLTMCDTYNNKISNVTMDLCHECINEVYYKTTNTFLHYASGDLQKKLGIHVTNKGILTDKEYENYDLIGEK